MVSSQKILICAVAATAVVLQGCDDGPSWHPKPSGSNPSWRNPDPNPDPDEYKPPVNPQENRLHPRNPVNHRNQRNNPQVNPVNPPVDPRKSKSKPKPKPKSVKLVFPSSERLFKDVQKQFNSRLSFKTVGHEGKGGFGEVHLATVKCQDGDKKVVVKIPGINGPDARYPEKPTPEWRIQHLKEEGPREVEMLNMVKGSPYFSQIFASVKSPDGFTSIMMEALAGDMHKRFKYISKTGPNIKPVNQRLNWTMQLLRGIKVLHDKGFMHRDLKTGNVMIGDDDRVRIIDLGAACDTRRSAGDRRCKNDICTIKYVPQEFMDSDRWNRSSPSDQKKVDVYAAGILLCHFFGKKNFTIPSFNWQGRHKRWFVRTVQYGQNMVEIFGDIANDRFFDAIVLDEFVPLRNILKRMLAQRVEDRVDIDQAIRLFEQMLPTLTPPFVEDDAVIMPNSKVPACLKKCYENNCDARCKIQTDNISSPRARRVRAFQTDVCDQSTSQDFPAKGVETHVEL